MKTGVRLQVGVTVTVAGGQQQVAGLRRESPRTSIIIAAVARSSFSKQTKIIGSQLEVK